MAKKESAERRSFARKQVRDGAVQQPGFERPRRIPLRDTPADKRDFFADVMDLVRQIPRGRVTSYGAIARYLGAARSARIVGYCMNNSHTVKPKVPAHRVVNSSGLLTGKHHFGPEDRMRKLLERDGVKVKDDQVVDFARRFWDPASELGL